MFACRSARRSAVASATSLMFSIDDDTCRARAAERLHDRVGVDGERRELLVLAREQSQHLVDLAQRGVGAPDHLVEVLAAAGEPDAQLVEDDRQALALGLAHDVVEQVEVHGLLVFSTGSRRWPLPGPSSISASSRGGSASTARCCVGSHSTNFSPISDCGRTVHYASLRKS